MIVPSRIDSRLHLYRQELKMCESVLQKVEFFAKSFLSKKRIEMKAIQVSSDSFAAKLLQGAGMMGNPIYSPPQLPFYHIAKPNYQAVIGIMVAFLFGTFVPALIGYQLSEYQLVSITMAVSALIVMGVWYFCFRGILKSTSTITTTVDRTGVTRVTKTLIGQSQWHCQLSDYEGVFYEVYSERNLNQSPHTETNYIMLRHKDRERLAEQRCVLLHFGRTSRHVDALLNDWSELLGIPWRASCDKSQQQLDATNTPTTTATVST